MLKCVVAEDEALLRESLVQLLGQVWPELEIVAACEDGGSALEAIAAHQPDVAFLDIRMPGLSGLEVASAVLDAGFKTEVVFVTAYDQYAIDAFERGAVDYLLKPVSRERLAGTAGRLRERLQRGGQDAGQLQALLQQLSAIAPPQPKAPPLVWLTASRGQETRLILVDDVSYFQADSKYTVVMTADGESLLRKPIRDLLEVLDPSMFKQVHRSTIVNLRAVAGVTRDESGRGTLRLKNRPETLAVSQPFMALFRNM
ncbi:LytR/AlgR family response regulator transcription factor [Massilia yuzhufengensis]|uniref:Two component transcriptional regulator, LytTR family n=1 Tax=Massilia yuzhufengensis TaxID=1164594 RepID=A0A1I1PR47_9BURK|nr:LytTR family DNA-binding domain-containing protein [Massilia yuzhufengensis]SFD09533.1 two component transcriptional regulator, LytTR family [Massilia yuzhufengensis]